MREEATAPSRQPRRKKRSPRVRQRNKRAIHSRGLKRSHVGRRRSGRGRLSSPRLRVRRGSASQTKTVVVVDEDRRSRRVLVRLLEQLGYRVMEAANGVEARRLAATAKRIDLLLAEFCALGHSGVELIKWFSANRPEISVLVASDWLWEVESCLGDLPRVGVLAREFTAVELSRMVRAVLR